MAIIASGNHSVLSKFEAENLPSPLFLTGGGMATRGELPPVLLPLPALLLLTGVHGALPP